MMQCDADLASDTTFPTFAAMNASAIETHYGVTQVQAQYFVDYIKYLQVLGIGAGGVTTLFASTGKCTLTTEAGVSTWMKIAVNRSALATDCPDVLVGSDGGQVDLLLDWFSRYLSATNQTLFTNTGVSTSRVLKIKK